MKVFPPFDLKAIFLGLGFCLSATTSGAAPSETYYGYQIGLRCWSTSGYAKDVFSRTGGDPDMGVRFENGSRRSFMFVTQTSKILGFSSVQIDKDFDEASRTARRFVSDPEYYKKSLRMCIDLGLI